MMDEQTNLSYLYGANAPYIEELYENYLRDRNSVDDYWKSYFDKVAALPGYVAKDIPQIPIQASFTNISTQPHGSDSGDVNVLQKQVAVLNLMNAYRTLGTYNADLDPLKRRQKEYIPELDPAYYGLTQADMNTKFYVSSDFAHSPKLALSEIINKLDQTYCGSVGVEYMHIIDPQERKWVQERVENNLSTGKYTADQKRRMLTQLTAAETLERYLLGMLGRSAFL